MEYNVEEKEVILNRALSELDKFVIDFCKVLKDYVIVSGYVSIIFGRSRATEDVDLLVKEMDVKGFKELWNKLDKDGFECINTSNIEEAFEMLGEHAIRFARKGKPTPNIEFKVMKSDIGKYSYENKIKVILGEEELFVSPLESQIAYKLFLAADGTDEELLSDKDIEDAKHLYKLFLEKINKDELLVLAKKLKVERRLRLLENEGV